MDPCACHPDRAIARSTKQAEILAEPALRQLSLDYDHAHNFDADASLFDDFAHWIAEAARSEMNPTKCPIWMQPLRFPTWSRARPTHRPPCGSDSAHSFARR